MWYWSHKTQVDWSVVCEYSTMIAVKSIIFIYFLTAEIVGLTFAEPAGPAAMPMLQLKIQYTSKWNHLHNPALTIYSTQEQPTAKIYC